MKPIFADPVAWWVPLTTVALIVGGTWVTALWNDEDIGLATRLCIGLAIVLLILIGLHGRLFWRGQVATLDRDGQTYKVATSAWVGPGRRLTFSAADTSDWTARPRTTSKPGDPPKLGTIYFTAKGERFEMSFVNPMLIDLDGLTAMNPAYFAKLVADYPALKSKAA